MRGRAGLVGAGAEAAGDSGAESDSSARALSHHHHQHHAGGSSSTASSPPASPRAAAAFEHSTAGAGAAGSRSGGIGGSSDRTLWGPHRQRPRAWRPELLLGPDGADCDVVLEDPFTDVPSLAQRHRQRTANPRHDGRQGQQHGVSRWPWPWRRTVREAEEQQQQEEGMEAALAGGVRKQRLGAGVVAAGPVAEGVTLVGSNGRAAAQGVGDDDGNGAQPPRWGLDGGTTTCGVGAYTTWRCMHVRCLASFVVGTRTPCGLLLASLRTSMTAIIILYYVRTPRPTINSLPSPRPLPKAPRRCTTCP